MIDDVTYVLSPLIVKCDKKNIQIWEGRPKDDVLGALSESCSFINAQ